MEENKSGENLEEKMEKVVDLTNNAPNTPFVVCKIPTKLYPSLLELVEKNVSQEKPKKTHNSSKKHGSKSKSSKKVKGTWTKEEDEKLLDIVGRLGAKKWPTIALDMEGRNGKQCRERYLNHLDPTINHGDWSKEEDNLIAEMHSLWGNQWAKMARKLQGRPANKIKNRWNSTLSKGGSTPTGSNVRGEDGSEDPTPPSFSKMELDEEIHSPPKRRFKRQNKKYFPNSSKSSSSSSSSSSKSPSDLPPIPIPPSFPKIPEIDLDKEQKILMSKAPPALILNQQEIRLDEPSPSTLSLLKKFESPPRLISNETFIHTPPSFNQLTPMSFDKTSREESFIFEVPKINQLPEDFLSRNITGRKRKYGEIFDLGSPENEHKRRKLNHSFDDSSSSSGLSFDEINIENPFPSPIKLEEKKKESYKQLIERNKRTNLMNKLEKEKKDLSSIASIDEKLGLGVKRLEKENFLEEKGFVRSKKVKDPITLNLSDSALFASDYGLNLSSPSYVSLELFEKEDDGNKENNNKGMLKIKLKEKPN